MALNNWRDISMFRKNLYFGLITIIVVIVAFVCTIANFVLLKNSDEDTNMSNKDIISKYRYHFAMIYADDSSGKWKDIYESANAYANDNDGYVELIGDLINNEYSKAELMKLAILSGVDGIIVEGDDSIELTEMIDEAYKKGIPVVTIMTDAPNSMRNSFVGINNYDVGLEFGNEIIKLYHNNKKKNVMVLMGNNDGYQEQHNTYQAIIESLSDEYNVLIDTKLLNNENEFSTDEVIREILVNLLETPDLLVCLSESITESAFQQVVEYNKVDSISVIGLASSDISYNAVSKGLIDSVISFDREMAGKKCAEALIEYIKNGYVNEFYIVDTDLVTKENVGRFVADEE